MLVTTTTTTITTTTTRPTILLLVLILRKYAQGRRHSFESWGYNFANGASEKNFDPHMKQNIAFSLL